jgi:hypothetical protein
MRDPLQSSIRSAGQICCDMKTEVLRKEKHKCGALQFGLGTRIRRTRQQALPVAPTASAASSDSRTAATFAGQHGI